MKKKTDISQVRFKYKKDALDIKNSAHTPTSKKTEGSPQPGFFFYF